MITDSMDLSEVANEIRLELPEICEKISKHHNKDIARHFNKNKSNLIGIRVYPNYSSFTSKKENKYLVYYHRGVDNKLTSSLFCTYLHNGKRKYAMIQLDLKIFFFSHHFLVRFKERMGKDDFVYVVKELMKFDSNVLLHGDYVASTNGVIPFKRKGREIVFITYMNDLSEYNKYILNSISNNRGKYLSL